MNLDPCDGSVGKVLGARPDTLRTYSCDLPKGQEESANSSKLSSARHVNCGKTLPHHHADSINNSNRVTRYIGKLNLIQS